MNGDDHELDKREAFAAEVDPWMTEPAREGEFDVIGAVPWE